jgi:hypothetical protein
LNIVDGGRTRRTRESFVALLRPGLAARGIVRLDGPSGTRVRALANGQPIGEFDVGDDEDWVERTFEIPASVASERVRIELRVDEGAVTTFHYWFVTPG